MRADRSGVLLPGRGEWTTITQSQAGVLGELGVVLRVDVVENTATAHLNLPAEVREPADDVGLGGRVRRRLRLVFF